MKNNNKYNGFGSSNNKVKNKHNKEKISFADKLEFISDLLELIFGIVDIIN